MSARKGKTPRPGRDPEKSSSVASSPTNQKNGGSSKERASRVFYGEPLPGQSQTPEELEKERVGEWLRPRMDRALADKNYRKALDALSGYLQPEFSKSDFSRNLTGFACIGLHPSRWGRKAWESVWTRNTGKTWKSLRDFPDRICGMAEEMKRVNESFAFSPAQCADAQTREAAVVRKLLNQLPAILCAYAQLLERQIDRVPVMTAQAFPALPRGHSPAILALMVLVKFQTGKPRDRMVADLLNAAALALGEKSEFDALTIAQLRSRRRPKPPKT